MPFRQSVGLASVAAVLLLGGVAAAGAADEPEPPEGRAVDPAVEAGASWWAFQPVRRPEVPRVAVDPPAPSSDRNPIDAFVRQAQAEQGIAPGPEADRVTLIRRLSFDLTGLPPSPAEVDAFVADERPQAYERLVDRLLASPAYGERWGRLWLDLARYADSDGFEDDKKRPDAWRYRDWVVNALNDDMPFDRFVALQLAADELEPEQPGHRAALGFLRNGPAVGNQKNEKIRMDELDDVVSTTSSVFLGLTVACARCHDHKFDPIPMEDYYRLVAVFAPGRFADVPLATQAEQEAYRQASQAVEEQADTYRVAILAIERPVRAELEAQKKQALPDAWRKAFDSGDLAQLTKAEQDDLRKRLQVQPEEVDQALSALEASARAELRARLAVVESRRPAPLPKAPGVVESGPKPAPVHLLFRGDVARKGPAVRPGPLRAVAGRVVEFADGTAAAVPSSSGRRAALARWIASDQNPLTARVQVNRIWQGHVGTGLVATPSDFGSMGEEPALPRLLDWLAAEFMASGWSQKQMHRLIVTSATYRQSSRIRPDAQAADPDNTLWWRYPVRRLEAETLRDAILWCAGTLNATRGGPGVFPPIDPSIVRTGNIPRWPLDARDGPDVWRRSLYIFRQRSVPLPMLEVFDAPDSTQSCPRRAQTTIPTQSLTLLNNPFVLDQARRFAERVAREAGPNAGARAVLAYRLACGRTPDEPTETRLAAFLTRQAAWHQQHDPDAPAADVAALTDLCQVLFNANGFLYVD